MGDLDGRPGGGPAADAAQHALFLGQAAGDLEGVVVLDLNDLVDDPGVQDAGNEAGADALDAMGRGSHRLAGHLLRDDRAVDRLDGDGLEARLALLDDLADAGDGAARADAGDENIDLAVRVVPDLFSGCLAVDLGV